MSSADKLSGLASVVVVVGGMLVLLDPKDDVGGVGDVVVAGGGCDFWTREGDLDFVFWRRDAVAWPPLARLRWNRVSRWLGGC